MLTKFEILFSQVEILQISVFLASNMLNYWRQNDKENTRKIVQP